MAQFENVNAEKAHFSSNGNGYTNMSSQNQSKCAMDRDDPSSMIHEPLSINHEPPSMNPHP
jgi:hypothetical protein